MNSSKIIINSPFRLFLLIVSSIILIEIGMLALNDHLILSDAILHTIILVVSFSLIFYFFVFRPISKKILESDKRLRSEEIIQQKNKNLAALLEISQLFVSTLDIDIVLQNIIDRATHLIGLDTGAIYLVKEEDLFLGAVTPPLPPQFPDIFRHALLREHPHIEKAIKSGLPLSLFDAQNAVLSTEEKIIVESRNMISLLYIPLMIENRAVGILILGTQKQKRNFSEAEIDLYRTLSSQAALVIVNAQLYKTVQDDAYELEQRVKERTSQLENANKELEFFSYSVSHDLRAPLRSIDGFSQLLLAEYSDKLDENGKDYLSRISSSVQKMSVQINDMLNLAHVTRTPMKIENVNLSEIAKSVITMLKENNKDSFIECVITENMIDKADPVLIKVVLQNLFENAVKFSSKKSGTCIKFGVIMEDKKRIYFVRDKGAGFDMEYVNKLFTPFQRLHDPSEFSGTGIGLATVQRIINRHNGRVWAEGEINKGATFYFILKSN